MKAYQTLQLSRQDMHTLYLDLILICSLPKLLVMLEKSLFLELYFVVVHSKTYQNDILLVICIEIRTCGVVP